MNGVAHLARPRRCRPTRQAASLVAGCRYAHERQKQWPYFIDRRSSMVIAVVPIKLAIIDLSKIQALKVELAVAIEPFVATLAKRGVAYRNPCQKLAYIHRVEVKGGLASGKTRFLISFALPGLPPPRRPDGPHGPPHPLGTCPTHGPSRRKRIWTEIKRPRHLDGN